MSAEERAARASRLTQLLDDPDVKDAFTAVEEDLIEAWQTCFEPAERDNIWQAQHALGLLRSKLSAWSQANISALRRAK